MINAIFIIDASVGCIFYQEYKKLGEGLDQEMVSGFLIALQNFARETFGEAQHPRKLDLAGELRLVYSFRKEERLLAASVADAVDHPKLVKIIIDTIFDEFIRRFNHKFDQERGGFPPSDFVEYVDEVIKSKVSKRGAFSCFLGVLITGLLISAILIPFLLVMVRIDPEFATGNQLVLSFIFIIVGGFPQILMGYIAGTKKLAVVGSLFLTFVMIPIFNQYLMMNLFLIGFHPAYEFVGVTTWFMNMHLLLPEAIALSYLGGYWREIRCINPLRES